RRLSTSLPPRSKAKRVTGCDISAASRICPSIRASVTSAFVDQAVTSRIANATCVLDLGLQRPAILANSNFVILQPGRALTLDRIEFATGLLRVFANPGRLPLGPASLLTKPEPRGSPTLKKTIGRVRPSA